MNTDCYRCNCNLIMEAAISESLFEKQESSLNMLNINWDFILLFSDIILTLLINNNNNNNDDDDNNNNMNNNMNK